MNFRKKKIIMYIVYGTFLSCGLLIYYKNNVLSSRGTSKKTLSTQSTQNNADKTFFNKSDASVTINDLVNGVNIIKRLSPTNPLINSWNQSINKLSVLNQQTQKSQITLLWSQIKQTYTKLTT